MSGGYDPTKKYELIERLSFKKYFKAKSWPDYNRQLFDSIAGHYDLIDDLISLGMHLRFKRRAIRHAGIRPGDRVLDLCTGSGDIAVLIAQRFPSAEVIGLDASDKMLEIARRRGTRFNNLTFEKADVLHLPFKDGSFDCVFISFGLRNLDDLKKGLLEMKRVAKSGGRVTSLDLGKPKGAFLNFLYGLYFLHFVPFLGKIFFSHCEANAFCYLAESSKYYPAPDELVEIFRSQGLRDVKNYNFILGAVAQQIGTVP